MLTELDSRQRGLPARVLDLSTWPIAVLEGLVFAALLDQWLWFPVAVLLLHDRHLPMRLRQAERRALAGPSSARWVAGAFIGSLGGGTLLPTLTVLVATHGLLLLGLHALVRCGHFRPRVALVGTPEATRAVARKLGEAQGVPCEIVGAFSESSADLERLLALAPRQGLDSVLLVTSPASPPPTGSTLRKLQQLSVPLVQATPGESTAVDHDLAVDALSTTAFLEIARHFGTWQFGFAVTPNAHHLVRLERDITFRKSYAAADFVLLDSRFIAHWLRWTRGEHWQVCPGSELTAELFAQVLEPNDRLVIVGGTSAQVEQLRLRHGLREVHHHRPPMGFIDDAAATEDCLRFVERHSPFRFCLLAVGAPQQERIAAELKRRGRARGLALCVGASLDFLTGTSRRAPRWMRMLGLEWFHRWWQEPRRLTRRYLLECPQVFATLRRRPLRRRTAAFSPSMAPAAVPPDPAGSVPPANQRRTG